MDVDAKKLLSLIEARSLIYNFMNKSYVNKMKVEQMWAEIANEMNWPVSECKNKWTILRNSYTRYLREERNLPSGKQKKKWHLADDMAFLKDYIIQYRRTNNIIEITGVDDVIYEISDVGSPAALIEDAQSNTSTPRNSPVPSKRSRTSVSEMIAGPMIEFLQSKTREKPPENSNSLFFKSLLGDYERLSSKRQRSFRLHMINKMNELQEEEENDALNASTVLSTKAMSSYTTVQGFSIIEFK